jgi:hypothetical protein
MPELIVEHCQQMRSNLCWATCGDMLTAHYGVRQSQIAFANAGVALLGLENANCKATAHDIGRLINRMVPGLRMAWTAENAASMTFAQVRDHIDNRRLIIGFRNAHATLIVGYDQVDRKPALILHDPAHAPGAHGAQGPIFFDTYRQGWVASAWVTSWANAQALDPLGVE